MADCPQCRTQGTISVRLVLVAKPLGSFSLAGEQMKVSARRAAVAECSSCGLSVSGHLENPTIGPDGATGGHFVADAAAALWGPAR